jgi:hypothetical protein
VMVQREGIVMLQREGIVMLQREQRHRALHVARLPTDA